MSLVFLIFLWQFLTPFIFIGLTLLARMITAMFGRVQVRHSGDHGEVRTGVGALNWTRRFDPRQVHAVRTGYAWWSDDNEGKHLPAIELVLDNDRVLRFGAVLTDERRLWMMKVLRESLVSRRLHNM